MRTGLRLPTVLFAAALHSAAAAPAAACTLMALDDVFIARAVRDNGSIWIGRVTTVIPGPEQTTNQLFGPSGQVRIAPERRLRGGTPAEITSRYDKHPFCGYPWDPRVGERVLVVRAFGGAHVLTAEQAGRTRYARHFAAD
jgi:hypothetical protein